MLKNAIRLLVGGFLYDEENADKIEEIPSLLREIADDYEREIKNYLD